MSENITYLKNILYKRRCTQHRIVSFCFFYTIISGLDHIGVHRCMLIVALVWPNYGFFFSPEPARHAMTVCEYGVIVMCMKMPRMDRMRETVPTPHSLLWDKILDAFVYESTIHSVFEYICWVIYIQSVSDYKRS